MADDKRYNGWTNYETWNVALWMDNDKGSYDYWREEAEHVYNNAEADNSFTRKERATLDLDDVLKEFWNENVPEITGAYADLLNAALSEVNWHEIAEHLIDEVTGE